MVIPLLANQDLTAMLATVPMAAPKKSDEHGYPSSKN